MGPGGPMMGPPPGSALDKNREPKPKRLREIPGYLCRLISKFFYRLFYIFRLVWETRPWILFVMMFTAIFDGAMPVVGAMISSKLINRLAQAFGGGEELLSGILFLLILQFGHLFLTRLVAQVSQILNNIAGELVVNHVNVKIMNKAKEVDLSGFDRPEFYEKLENASREAGHRPIQILRANFTIISSIISMVSFIVILYAVSPAAPLVVAALSIPSAVISFVYRRKNFLYMRHRSKDRRQMSYYSGLMTNKDVAKEVRLFGLSNTFIGRYREVFGRYFKGLKKLFLTEGFWQIGLSLITTIVNCTLFVMIALGVLRGEYEVGDYSLYTGALTSISSGIATLIMTIASIYEGTLFIDNMITFMEEKKTIVPTLDEPRPLQRHIAHRFELRDVSFRYPGTQRDVLKHINLTIEAGSTVVLVGLNGAGKTTLIKLLTRLYDPTEGVILLDGYDIREYRVEDVYAAFGIIFQDFGKYAVSVKENIRFGQLSREENAEDIRAAAQKSSAEAFIDALPHGFDTPLMRYFEPDGIELSIGQWQKLSIARAFYSESDILILDEPTASLDAIAEQEIYRQFDELRRERTTIFVSHRLSSATTADNIVVLKNGTVVEEGNHSQLIADGGEYARLFLAQAERYVTEKKEEESEPSPRPPMAPPHPMPPPFPRKPQE
ncbi:MAG: ABC transporter ATP-binding protein [Ruminococcaceae bacterium]|nr:ABC transporter ATP-binding protein [Oscillospiraceae bacterium]